MFNPGLRESRQEIFIKGQPQRHAMIGFLEDFHVLRLNSPAALQYQHLMDWKKQIRCKKPENRKT